MKFTTHFTDLYILPENVEEREILVDYLKTSPWKWHWSYSNVEGQDWFGKQFIEIPFGCTLKEEIEKL